MKNLILTANMEFHYPHKKDENGRLKPVAPVVKAPSLGISLRPRGLAEGIDGFCGKVETDMKDILSKVMANNGKIEGDLKIKISTMNHNLGHIPNYNHEMSIVPKDKLHEELADFVANSVKQLGKDLSHVIIHSSAYQRQTFCYLEELQEENRK